MNNASTVPMPRSIGLSVLLHLAILVALLVAAWWSQQIDDDTPVIFELVAGEGDNYAATEAPTTTESLPTITLTLPEPLPEPVRIQPTPTPPRPQPTPPKPVPVPKAVEKTPTPIKVKPVPEAKPVVAEPVPKTVSFAEFAKQNGTPTPTVVKAPAPIRAPKINVGKVTSAAESSVKVGAGGTAMTASEVNLSAAYKALIVQRIRQALEAAGINDVREADVEFYVNLEGAISNAQIIKSSGSSKFDQAVISAFRSIRPLGRPPTGRAETLTTTIRLRER
jgi:colicin import membrane protein